MYSPNFSLSRVFYTTLRRFQLQQFLFELIRRFELLINNVCISKVQLFCKIFSATKASVYAKNIAELEKKFQFSKSV